MSDKKLVNSAVKSAYGRDKRKFNRSGKHFINEKDSQAIADWELKLKKQGLI